ncbi:MAG: DUF1285 domain-containing protein, partial [Halocynthiibacter sp.]
EHKEDLRPLNTGLSSLKGLGLVSQSGKRGRPPLHLWNPPYCGEIDIRITADGTWFHEGTPIGRPALVRLFASILIGGDDGRHYLITPVEKVGITVEDAPFQAVGLAVENRGRNDQHLVLTTNVGDEVAVGPDHPLDFQIDEPTAGLKPYVLVRDWLKARVSRAITYDLVELAGVEAVKGEDMFGVRSGGVFFPICPAGEVGN